MTTGAGVGITGSGLRSNLSFRAIYHAWHQGMVQVAKGLAYLLTDQVKRFSSNLLRRKDQMIPIYGIHSHGPPAAFKSYHSVGLWSNRSTTLIRRLLLLTNMLVCEYSLG